MDVINTEIKKIREYQDLTLANGPFNLSDFTTINNRGAFRVRNAYKFENWRTAVYLISYYNPFFGKKGEPEPSGAALYWGAYLVFQSRVPDTIILPKTLPYRLAELFFHDNIKVESAPEFDRKYLLQSVDKTGIVKILSVEFFDIIQKFDDLHIEIRNNRCFVYFLRPPVENDGFIFLEIIQKLVEIDNAGLHL